MTENTKDILTAEERIELEKYLGAGAPMPEEKHNSHTFLYRVATADDTTKLGYLSDEEVGNPKHPIRTYKELALFCKEIADMNYMTDYFNKLSEITTSTSLSKDAKLLTLAVIQRRQIEDVTKRKQKPRGFFKKKEENEE